MSDAGRTVASDGRRMLRNAEIRSDQEALNSDFWDAAPPPLLPPGAEVQVEAEPALPCVTQEGPASAQAAAGLTIAPPADSEPTSSAHTPASSMPEQS